MSDNKQQPITGISKARNIEEISEFWDTHSVADYWEQTQDAEFEVRAQRRHRIILDPDIYARIEEQARLRGILPETLVNVWVAERLEHVG